MDFQEKTELEQKVVGVLKSIYDPEIPVDVYELGLIYDIAFDEERNAKILMTLTSPNCPVAESLPQEIQDKIGAIEGIASAKVEITFEPTWNKDMMSEEAQLELGFL
jgi:FeS assembly SUF system protein